MLLRIYFFHGSNTVADNEILQAKMLTGEGVPFSSLGIHS